MKRFFLGCFLAGLSFAARAAEAGDWEEARRVLLERPRRIIVDNDGCDVTNFPPGVEVTPANVYRQMLDRTIGRDIDAIVYCPFSVGLVLSTATKVTERHANPAADGLVNAAPELLERFDTDGLRLAVEFCRRERMEIFAGVRVNDTHDATWTRWMPRIKREHPEYLVGSRDRPPPFAAWSAFDYARKPVRDLLCAIVAELAADYDLDGVALDFYRHPVLFGSAAWGQPVSRREMLLLTDMMRQIRSELETAGRRRGRPLLLACRLPDSVDACRAMGIDLEQWLGEGLFDLYFAAGDIARFEPWALTAERCRRAGIRFYPSVDGSWITEAAGHFDRNVNPSFDAQSLAAWTGGADGIYYFNMFYQPGYFPNFTRDPGELRRRDKRYFVSVQKLGRFGGAAAFPRCNLLPELSPQSPADLPDGGVRSFRLELGDEAFAEAAALNLRLAASIPDPDLSVAVNGRTLARDPAGGFFRVPAELLRPGLNDVAVTGGTNGLAAATALTGGELLKGANQPPWRRLFSGNARAGAEAIRDGAYLLNDMAPGAVTNLLYPLTGIDGGDLEVEFDLRVDPGTQPRTAVLRLANGARAEEISFEPRRIGLTAAGATAAFDAADRFHHYRAILRGDELMLYADGEPLLRSRLFLDGDAPALRLPASTFYLPEIAAASLIIGSLNPGGTGASAWKNLRLCRSPQLTDLVLEIVYPPQPPARLAPWRDAAVAWDYLADFSGGAVPPECPVRHEYRPGRLRPAADGTGVVLDHNDPYDYQVFRAGGVPERPGASILVAEWRLRLPRDAEPGRQPVRFQMILRPPLPADAGRYYQCVFRFEPGAVIHPWGRREMPDGFDRWRVCRAAIDLDSGAAVLWIDGEPVAAGGLGSAAGPGGFLWGDASDSIDGVAELGEVKLAWPEE